MTNLVDIPDRLEDAWRKLGETIRQREAELSELKLEFQVLDQARILLLTRAAGGSFAAFAAKQQNKVGLRDAVLASVDKTDIGLTFQELCLAVKGKVDMDRYANERSFVAAVQTTTRRLVARGEISLGVQDKVQRYTLGPQNADTIPDEE